MKKYEDLTEFELEKLNTYLLTIINTNLKTITGLIVSLVFMATGVLLLNSLPSTGFIFSFVGLLIFLSTALDVSLTKKYLLLAYRTTDSFKDIFKIKKSDLKKVKFGWYIEEDE